MKVIKTSIYAIIVFTTISCGENRLEELSYDNALTASYMEFTASMGSETRTQLTNENKVEWLAGDAISIFDGEANRKFTTEQNGTNVIFGGKANNTTIYYALYPYQENASLTSNVINNVSLPTEQTAKDGSFEAAYNISVAFASRSDLLLNFMNIGSLVKISMVNDKATDIRNIRLTSNNSSSILTGTVDINVDSTPSITFRDKKENYVTLNSDKGFEIGKNYFFAIFPNVMKEGFTLTFTDKDGLKWQKKYTTEAVLNRSVILNIKPIELGSFSNDNSGDFNINDEGDEFSYTETYDFTKNLYSSVAVNGVGLNKYSIELEVGESESLIATVTPNNASNKSVIWNSNDKSIVSVDENGKVNALKEGFTTITVKTEDGGFTASCEVTINAASENNSGEGDSYDNEEEGNEENNNNGEGSGNNSEGSGNNGEEYGNDDADMQVSISFSDNKVKTVCVNNWDTNKDGEMSYAEAASVTTIGTAFKGTGIKNFEEFQYFSGITSIPNNAFDGYNNNSSKTLVSIILPESIVSIGEYAFRQQTSLTTITIPQNVTSLGMQAFAGCGALKTIYFKSATPPTYGSDAVPDIIQKIYVPAGSVNSYKAAFPSKFANKIVAGNY